MDSWAEDPHKDCEILVNTTHDCNLKCKYCFVSDAYRGFDGNTPGLKMNRGTQDACLSFIEAYGRPYERITLHFYGGEPFTDFEALKYLAEKAAGTGSKIKKKIRFAVTTNGTLIDRRRAEFLNKMGFSVLVSIDGPPGVHDKMRVTTDGKPTYDKVYETVNLLKSFDGIRLGLSAVVHKYNSLGAAYGFLKSLEPDYVKVENIYTTAGHPLDLDETDREQYRRDLEAIADEVIDDLSAGKAPLDSRFNSRVLQRWRKGIREEFCAAGSHILGIAPNGDIFPCTLLVGEKSCLLGNVRDGIDAQAVKTFKEWHGCKGKPACTGCDVKDFCGGGCAAIWKTKGSGYCHMTRLEVEMALRVYNAVSRVKPEALALMVSKDFYDKINAFIHDETGAERAY